VFTFVLNIGPQPVEKLSRERPLGNIFNFYVLLSVLLQFATHIVSLLYITNLSHQYEPCVSSSRLVVSCINYTTVLALSI
jgi:magnesium-transporting ATPase (P-type)